MKKNGAKRFNAVQKASCLKQNQKWEYRKMTVSVKTASDHRFRAMSALISVDSSENG